MPVLPVSPEPASRLLGVCPTAPGLTSPPRASSRAGPLPGHGGRTGRKSPRRVHIPVEEHQTASSSQQSVHFYRKPPNPLPSRMFRSWRRNGRGLGGYPMPSGSSSRCRRRPGVLTLARIVATINATIPAAAHEIGSSMTRSSVFTRTVPPCRGCTTLRASSRAVPSWRSARRARSKSISNPITSASSSIISHSVPACTPSTAAGTRGQSAYPSKRSRNRNASVAC